MPSREYSRIEWAKLQIDRLDPDEHTILLVCGPQDKREPAQEALQSALTDRSVAVVAAPDARSLVFRTIRTTENSIVLVEGETDQQTMQAISVLNDALSYIEAPDSVAVREKPADAQISTFTEQMLRDMGWTPPGEQPDGDADSA